MSPVHSHHDHSQYHTHAPAISQRNERNVLIAFVLITLFMLVEFAGGLYSGSLALIADAGHMLTDAVALVLAWAAFRIGRRAADGRHTFGYLRAEVIAGLINALTLILIVGWIGYEAWQRLNTPPQIMAWPMLAVAVAGLVVNLVVLRIITRGETEHVNIKAVILHVIGDLLGSLGAIVAAVVIYFTGWGAIDPILSVAVALLILKGAWKLLEKSLHILLEGAPENISPQQIREALLQGIPAIDTVSHIHIWQVTSGKVMATLHLRPRVEAEAKHLVRQAEKLLYQQFSVCHTTIAIDWHDAAAAGCSLSPSVRKGDDLPERCRSDI